MADKERENMLNDYLNQKPFCRVVKATKRKKLMKKKNNNWRSGCLVTLYEDAVVDYERKNVIQKYYIDLKEEEFVKVYETYWIYNDFYNTIQQMEYTKKNIFKFWKPFIGVKTSNGLFNALIIEYCNNHALPNRGFNHLALIIDIRGIDIIHIDDMNPKLHIQELKEKTGYDNRHTPYINKIMGLGQPKNMKINVKYTKYKEYFEPKKIITFDSNTRMNECGCAENEIFIRPLGYYTFENESMIYSNISSIYYKTEVKHTLCDFIIYEITDKYNEYTQEEKTKFTEKYLDKIYNHPFKDEPKKYPKKQIKQDDESSEDTTEEEEESSEDEEPVVEHEIVEPVIDEPVIEKEIIPTITFVNNKIEDQYKITKMIKKSYKKKSLFYQLVSTANEIVVTNGIHNSYYNKEQHNHFNIYLLNKDGNRSLTYHIYVTDFKIHSYTEILVRYD